MGSMGTSYCFRTLPPLAVEPLATFDPGTPQSPLVSYVVVAIDFASTRARILAVRFGETRDNLTHCVDKKFRDIEREREREKEIWRGRNKVEETSLNSRALVKSGPRVEDD